MGRLMLLAARRLCGSSDGFLLGSGGLSTGFWRCRSNFRQNLCSHKRQGERGGLCRGLAVVLRLRMRHGVSCFWFSCTSKEGGAGTQPRGADCFSLAFLIFLMSRKPYQCFVLWVLVLGGNRKVTAWNKSLSWPQPALSSSG